MFIASAAIKIDLQKKKDYICLICNMPKMSGCMVQFLFAATFQEFHLIRALYNSFIGTGKFNLNLSVGYLYMHVGSH